MLRGRLLIHLMRRWVDGRTVVPDRGRATVFPALMSDHTGSVPSALASRTEALRRCELERGSEPRGSLLKRPSREILPTIRLTIGMDTPNLPDVTPVGVAS